MPMVQQIQEKKAGAAKPLQLDDQTASRVRRSFGLDPARLELGESEAVRAMGARAVAKGNVIQFAPGEFSPETPEGLQVLGHELAHVRSQARGEVPMTGGLLERPSYEAEADRAGEAFASGSLAAAGPVSPLSAAAALAAPAQGLFGRKKKQPAPKPERQKLGYEIGHEKMGELLAKGDQKGALTYMSEALEEQLLPTLMRDYESSKDKSLNEQVHDIAVGGFRDNTEFSAAHSDLLKSAPSSQYDISPLLNAAEEKGGAGGKFEEGEMDQLLADLVGRYSQNLANDESGQQIFGQFGDLLKEVPTFQDDTMRGRMMLNDVLLRSLTPQITSSMMALSAAGSAGASPMKALALRLQLSGNKYLGNGNQGTEEAPNPLHNAFDVLASQMSGMTAPELSRKNLHEVCPGYTAAKYWKRGSNTPLTEAQQALLDKWAGPAEAAAPKKKSRNPFKRLLAKIRGK